MFITANSDGECLCCKRPYKKGDTIFIGETKVYCEYCAKGGHRIKENLTWRKESK
jgi:hypothetical protein